MADDSRISADPRQRAFLMMNGAAFACVAVAAVLAWLAPRAASAMGIAAIVLVLAGIGLAVASYPFYRAFMRDEAAARLLRRRSKPGAR